MKRFFMLLLALMLLCPAALAESAQWTDGMYVLGESGYTIVLPEGMTIVDPDEEGEILAATMEGMSNGTGGLSISVAYYENKSADEYFEESYADLIATISPTFKHTIDSRSTPDPYIRYQVAQASGEACAYAMGGNMTHGPSKIKVMSAELYHREVIGLLMEAIIADGENLYAIAYSITADYMDTVQNIIAGTIGYEE